ncbi:hypothetical protein LMG24238_06220 [Paraburkholderia sediminicola]|uniref:Uncharacterized protein n=1 Tax=Paraburkholderia sediminicola TaxID=458836 RepID=A0A6J5CH98_9BURK|nr:hypothetical protein LMG24238_06220 [Paraburkholderia sediminicola]
MKISDLNAVIGFFEVTRINNLPIKINELHIYRAKFLMHHVIDQSITEIFKSFPI